MSCRLFLLASGYCLLSQRMLKGTNLLTLTLCLMTSIGHRRRFASSPDSGLSSPAPSSSDHFYAFLPRCLCVMCCWVFSSSSSPVDSRSEPTAERPVASPPMNASLSYNGSRSTVGCQKMKEQIGGRNSSVGSAWARCPQRRGFDPPLGTFSVEGIFPLELTWVQTPFPQKLLRMRV